MLLSFNVYNSKNYNINNWSKKIKKFELSFNASNYNTYSHIHQPKKKLEIKSLSQFLKPHIYILKLYLEQLFKFTLYEFLTNNDWMYVIICKFNFNCNQICELICQVVINFLEKPNICDLIKAKRCEGMWIARWMVGLIWLIEATLTENSVLETKILYAKYI